MTFEIFLNILIIALLTIGIVYVIILEHRLSSAKENRRELALLIDQFYKASRKTSEELIQLRTMEEQTRAALKADLDKAAFIRDELNFIINKAQKLQTAYSQPSLNETSPDPQDVKILSQAEKELMNALNALK